MRVRIQSLENSIIHTAKYALNSASRRISSPIKWRKYVQKKAPRTNLGAIDLYIERLLVIFFELLHELGELLDAFYRHRVVDACAHASDAAMALDRLDAMIFRLSDEQGIQIL